MPPRESVFERRLVRDLERRYPGAYVLKTYPNYLQGFPDRIFLYEDFWAVFDAKRDINSPARPNQAYYINRCNEMSFGMFVYPQNREVFLDGIQQSLESKGISRVP